MLNIFKLQYTVLKAVVNHPTPSNLTYAWNFGSLFVLNEICEPGDFYGLIELLTFCSWWLLIFISTISTIILLVYNYLSKPVPKKFHPFLNFQWPLILTFPIWTLVIQVSVIERLEIISFSYGMLFLSFHFTEWIRLQINPNNCVEYPDGFRLTHYPAVSSLIALGALAPLLANHMDYFYSIRFVVMSYGYSYIFISLAYSLPFIVSKFKYWFPFSKYRILQAAGGLGLFRRIPNRDVRIFGGIGTGVLAVGGGISAYRSALKDRQSREKMDKENRDLKEKMDKENRDLKERTDKNKAKALEDYRNAQIAEQRRHNEMMEKKGSWWPFKFVDDDYISYLSLLVLFNERFFYALFVLVLYRMLKLLFLFCIKLLKSIKF